MQLRATNEWANLKKVVVGTAQSMGGTPALEEAYDPKSKEHIASGTFPKEADCVRELDALATLLQSMDVEVLRPEVMPDLNQIFARDVGIVVEDRLVATRLIADREDEWQGVVPLLADVPASHILHPPEGVRVEGGDVMPRDGELWVGYSAADDFDAFTTARTNEAALDWLSDQFPHWNVRGFQLQKSDTDPKDNALHLDCCLSTFAGGHAVFHPGGLKLADDVAFVRDTFQGHVLEVSSDEMYDMQCNLISVTPEDVVSCPPFETVNRQLEAWGYRVHTTTLQETAKMEGLLRCVTMPLHRD
jgi:N-dimethylarginine dimethylaminohydrolase